MLLNCFFRTSASIRARGYVFFESTNPGTYEYNFKRNRKLHAECVGAGAGGSTVKIGLRYNAGSPSETTLIGAVSVAGNSGAYTSRTDTTARSKFQVRVGAAGSAYSTTNVVQIFDIDSSTTQGYSFPSSVSGGNSGVYYKNSGLIPWRAIASADGGYYSRIEKNSSGQIYVSYRYYGGNTINSNSGQNSMGQATNVYCSGGTSTYGGYGTGGASGWSGTSPDVTPWANNGSNGYVKVVFAD